MHLIIWPTKLIYSLWLAESMQLYRLFCNLRINARALVIFPGKQVSNTSDSPEAGEYFFHNVVSVEVPR